MKEPNDVKISRECCVRRQPDGAHGKTLNLRVGEPGWHREATHLTPAEARALRAELDAFISENER